MISFETYLLKQKLKNLRPGDKLRYIDKKSNIFKSNEILTFLKLVSEFFIIVEEHSGVLIHPKNIIKD